MSRSRRRTPIRGHTTAVSDHRWKKHAARKLRRTVRQTLKSNPLGFDLAGKRWDVVDPWTSDKDGKFWFGFDRPEWLRK